MSNYNQMIDLANSGTTQLLSYLERLKSHAEDLLRGVRGIYIITNPVNSSLKIKYEMDVPIDKDKFIKEMKLINDKTLLIIYSNNEYVLHDLIQNKPISSHKFPSSNYSNLQVFPHDQLKKQIEFQNTRSYDYLIAYFDLTLKEIAIYDLKLCLPISYQFFNDSLIEDSFVFKVIQNQIVVTYKKGDLTEILEDSQTIYHSYEIYEINYDDNEHRIKWDQKIKNTFQLANYFNDKSIILKNKSLILYNSFTNSNQIFEYYVYQENSVYMRKMKYPLEGQILEIIEYSNSNKVGFLINMHTDQQFKLLVHDLDQKTDYTENPFNFLQITKKILVTKVFCFIDDRYIGLSVQNIQYGAKNILYDIESQQIVCILQGSNIVDCNNKVNKLRILMHNDEDQLENHNLKFIYFAKQSTTLMKYLEEQGILKQYGEQACKEIIEMIV
ncbi:hypothetical protein TTHERM_00577390 (macronuclear) [Tetrahymena thermophila SB210]|uniref:Uncharacterized protein n=1 Tax=Tetrahymena thermophila (strain SB210) TaxID=312017 RepID=Q22UW4_TETTS|nr:hypothetical protein TTHERM_00577390 [Tetrahymena thermophila SB210]EAR89184.1 hypothetical protein TTHERM_00577390 [Tetrahymena thermophila SB210]|eukprot:XP_001009429.1 hypothetical protein TTHERM_00577390 [Tetrahymena thermophila SB210]